MKFICQQQNLIKALNIVSKAVSVRTTIPVLKGIMLKAESGKLTSGRLIREVEKNAQSAAKSRMKLDAMNAAKAKKHALCMVSISDHLFKEEALSAEDRQTSFRNMMEVALELV